MVEFHRKHITYALRKEILIFFHRCMARLKSRIPLSMRRALRPVASFLSRQYIMRLSVPALPPVKSINGVRFEFDFSEDPVNVRQLYFEVCQKGVFRAIQEILRPGDTFIDVGANIGYITAFGAGLVGKGGEVHAFEPVPESFEKLRKMTDMNMDYKIFANQCALGDRNGNAVMYLSRGHSINDSIVRDVILPGTVTSSIEVPLRRLDEYILGKNLKNISLVKIDVEGYEFPVLKGLEKFFLGCKKFPFIICEICPPSAPLLGYRMDDLFSYMRRFSYRPFDLFDFNTELDERLIGRQHTFDVLFKPE